MYTWLTDLCYFKIVKFLGICGQIMYSSDGYAFPETFYLGMYIDNNFKTQHCHFVHT
jgi:hypothetical protein